MIRESCVKGWLNGYRAESSPRKLAFIYEPRHAIMCLREINYVMRYDVLKSDVIISRRA